MSIDRQVFGARGEKLAKEFLIELGLEILELNYRWSRAEVDIIARQNKTIHFIEVKTRSYQSIDEAMNSVGFRKQQNIMTAAHHYCEVNGYFGDIQFDIIAVLVDFEDQIRISWRQDAFGFYN